MILDLKYIIWLWSKYVKRRHIPYMELEFHYPNYLFITLGCLVVAIFFVIAITYFQLNKENRIIAGLLFVMIEYVFRSDYPLQSLMLYV